VDQRGSLHPLLAKALKCEPEEIAFKDMAHVKALLTQYLAPYASAVLTDPIYGFPYSVRYLPRDVALLLAYEHSGSEKVGPSGDRVGKCIDGWTVEKAVRAGANAIKLLVHYHPDADPEPRARQQALVRQVGAECARHDRPFLLEVVTYAREEGDTGTPEFARRKPDLVRRYTEEFSRPEYQVDILKLEFPADLKYTKEFCPGAFDGRERPAVYTLKDVEEFCQAVEAAAGVPWVILSAGVDIAEFLIAVELAGKAGASGFLCGRAIWKEAVDLYPDEARMVDWLLTEGAYNFLRCNAAATNARPWYEHRPFNGWNQVAVAGISEEWYEKY